MHELRNLNLLSKQTGLPEVVLQNVYNLESKFYNEIINEVDFDTRQKLYEFVYTKTAEFTEPYSNNYFEVLVKAKKDILKAFKKEISGKSILDIGSGSGAFLYAIAKSNLSFKELYGLDVKQPMLPDDAFSKKINCFQRNAIKFVIPKQFDLAMLDNVYEHIAKADKSFFLDSIQNSLKSGGKLILIIPHREFGPSDWTILLDNSFKGEVDAHCLHLDETTYTDVIKELKKHNFVKFTSPIPFVVLNKVKLLIPNLRLPSSFFAWLESNKFLMKFIKLFIFKSKCMFRMQVIIIAEKG